MKPTETLSSKQYSVKQGRAHAAAERYTKGSTGVQKENTQFLPTSALLSDQCTDTHAQTSGIGATPHTSSSEAEGRIQILGYEKTNRDPYSLVTHLHSELVIMQSAYA